MKYIFDKKEIMKNAWTLVRKAGKSMSESLKMAWYLAKKVISYRESWGVTQKMKKWKQTSGLDMEK